MSRHMRKRYLSHRQTVKAQASLHICAVSPEPSLFAHTVKGVRGSFRQRATSLTLSSGRMYTFEWFQTAQCSSPCSHEMAHILSKQSDGEAEPLRWFSSDLWEKDVNIYKQSTITTGHLKCMCTSFCYFRKTGSPSHNLSVVKSFQKCNCSYFKFYRGKLSNKKIPYGVMLNLGLFSLLFAINNTKEQRNQTENKLRWPVCAFQAPWSSESKVIMLHQSVIATEK